MARCEADGSRVKARAADVRVGARVRNRANWASIFRRTLRVNRQSPTENGAAVFGTVGIDK